MNNTSKKYENALSFIQVYSLTQYVEWVNKISNENMLFRGMANADWKVESSLYRRLKFNNLDVSSTIFLEMTKVLIKRSRKEGYDIETIPKLNDLELLANLQHYGAATCLIDFTKHSLIALCFACETAHKKDNNKEANGRVFAFNSDNVDLYNEISIESSDGKIEPWLTEYEKNKKLWILSPKKRNNRIASQQSVFVFGRPTLPNKNFHICEIDTTKKEEILEDLKKNGISVGMLFDDFVGFSALNSHNKKYEPWDTDDWSSYNNRGIAKKALANSQKDTISDYDKVSKFQEAINDYNEAIRLNPEYSVAYFNRGNTLYDLHKFEDAINDYSKAIEFNPDYGVAYHNRGVAKNKLNDTEGAAADFTKAEEIERKRKNSLSDN